MASKFGSKNPETGEWEGTAPIHRQHDIEGYEVNIEINGDGVFIQRKGDKNREKATLYVKWGDIMEIGADKQKERGELVYKGKECQSAYDFLGFEE